MPKKVLVLTVSFTTAQNCLEDYSPFECTLYGDGTISVDCDQVPVRDVQIVFNRTTTRDLYRLDWTLLSEPIPSDVLSDKRAIIIRLACPFASSGALVMDPLALRATGGYTNELYISDCDLGRLDFAFLSGFTRLLILGISSSSNVHTFSTLPPLPALKELSIFDCSGLESLTTVPGLASVHLENLKLNSNGLSDGPVDVVLDSINASALTRLSLNDNRLTRIPGKVVQLPQLAQLYMSDNAIPLLQTGSLAFPLGQRVDAIYLPSVGLESIEPGTFQG